MTRLELPDELFNLERARSSGGVAEDTNDASNKDLHESGRDQLAFVVLRHRCPAHAHEKDGKEDESGGRVSEPDRFPSTLVPRPFSVLRRRRKPPLFWRDVYGSTSISSSMVTNNVFSAVHANSAGISCGVLSQRTAHRIEAW
jgi:hypothetical protein